LHDPAIDPRGLLFALLLAGGPALAGIPERTALREILIHEQSRNGTDSVLVRYTQDWSKEVRARAYRALGRLQDPASWKPWPRASRTRSRRSGWKPPSPWVSSSTPSRNPPHRGSRHGSRSRVKARLVEGLGKCGTETVVPRLAGFLAGTDPVLAQESALALGALALRSVPIVEAADALRAGLTSADPELRWRAAYAVQRGKVSAVNIQLRQALKQKDALTLMFAARAAGPSR